MSQELQSQSQVLTHPVSPDESSFVRGINYLPESELMEVRLKKGDGEMAYYYPDTSQHRYERFVDASNYGKYYSKYIRQGGANRDYGSAASPSQKEKLEEALQNTTEGIVQLVRANNPELFEEYEDLFECVKRRKHDIKVLTVEDNGHLLKLVFEFRQQIVTQALDVIRQSYSEDPEWLVECEEMADECATTSTTYMALTNL